MQKSIRALKSRLFTPGNKSDGFSMAAEVRADALIIDLEDAVARNSQSHYQSYGGAVHHSPSFA